MSPASGFLLVVAILSMIGLVILLSRRNVKNLTGQERRETAGVGLVPRATAIQLANLEWLWRRTDTRRNAWNLHDGSYGGWDVRAFLFAHDPDTITNGARLLTRIFAHNYMPLTSLATDARTARQRGILVAVDYDDEPAAFKLRGRQVVARNAQATSLLGGRSAKLRTWSPPARVRLVHDWLFLESFYVVPKWLGRYVHASTQICDLLEASEFLQRRHDSELPVGPLF